MGVEWFGMVMGLGFVLSFGYWCTDFLVVQRAMAADSMNAAQRTPLIAAMPKILFPFMVIVPGIAALGLTLHPNAGADPLLPRLTDGTYDYNMALPLMMGRYYPAGMLIYDDIDDNVDLQPAPPYAVSGGSQAVAMAATMERIC